MPNGKANYMSTLLMQLDGICSAGGHSRCKNNAKSDGIYNNTDVALFSFLGQVFVCHV